MACTQVACTQVATHVLQEGDTLVHHKVRTRWTNSWNMSPHQCGALVCRLFVVYVYGDLEPTRLKKVDCTRAALVQLAGAKAALPRFSCVLMRRRR